MKGLTNSGDKEFYSLENHYFFFPFQTKFRREKEALESWGKGIAALVGREPWEGLPVLNMKQESKKQSLSILLIYFGKLRDSGKLLSAFQRLKKLRSRIGVWNSGEWSPGLVAEDQQHPSLGWRWVRGVGTSNLNVDRYWQFAFKNMVSIYAPIQYSIWLTRIIKLLMATFKKFCISLTMNEAKYIFICLAIWIFSCELLHGGFKWRTGPLL